MTREQKIEWTKNADTWELIKQLDFMAGAIGIKAERYGSCDERTLETVEDKAIIYEELHRRLGQ